MTVYINKLLSQQKKPKEKKYFSNGGDMHCQIIPKHKINNKRANQLYAYLGTLTNNRNSYIEFSIIDETTVKTRIYSVFPSLKTMASNLQCSVSTIQRALRYLEEHAYMEKSVQYRANGSQTSNTYEIKNIKERKIHRSQYATIEIRKATDHPEKMRSYPQNVNIPIKMTTLNSKNNIIYYKDEIKVVLINSDEHRISKLQAINHKTFEIINLLKIYSFELEIRGIHAEDIVCRWKHNRLKNKCRTQGGIRLMPSKFLEDLEFWIKREIKVKKPKLCYIKR